MSIKVYNKNTNQSAVCERPDWTKCRDHNPEKGWSVHPNIKPSNNDKNFPLNIEQVKNNADGENVAETVSFDEYEKTGASLQEDYEKFHGLMSTDYSTRAEALREKNIETVRVEGLGSNFNVLNQSDSGRKDNLVWVGTCDVCGERVFNNKNKGYWEHETNIVGGKSITTNMCAEANKILAGKEEARNTVDENASVINIGWVFNLADKIKNTVNGGKASNENINMESFTSTTNNELRCQGFTAQGTPCTSGVAPEYSNEYCHQHYQQGFN
jgi:hypothetical protein